MADSIRQQIVDALKTLLATITVANGYETNLGSNVFEWRTTQWQESEIPGISVSDINETVDRKGITDFHSLSIQMEIKTTGATSSAVMRDAIADVDKAIGTDQNLGGLCQSITPVENDSTTIEQSDKVFSSTLIKILVIYRTKIFAPYTLA